MFNQMQSRVRVISTKRIAAPLSDELEAKRRLVASSTGWGWSSHGTLLVPEARESAKKPENTKKNHYWPKYEEEKSAKIQ